MISESASGDQLRRLWQNLKTHQRDALTRERQHRMSTGGGGPCPDADINPNIAEISPALLVEIQDTLDSDCIDFIPETIQAVEPIIITQNLPTQPVEEEVNIQPSSSESRPEGNNIPSLQLSSNEKKLRVQILKEEFINREQRAAQLHQLQVKHIEEKHVIEMEILKEKLKEAKAKAESAQH